MVSLAALRIIKDASFVVLAVSLLVSGVPVAVSALPSRVLAVVLLPTVVVVVVVVLISSASTVVPLRTSFVYSIGVCLFFSFDFVPHLSAFLAPAELSVRFESIVPINSDSTTINHSLV